MSVVPGNGGVGNPGPHNDTRMYAHARAAPLKRLHANKENILFYYPKGVFTVKIVSAKKSSLGKTLKKSVKQEIARVVHGIIICKKKRQGAVSAES